MMGYDHMFGWGSPIASPFGGFGVLFLILFLWSTFWKGLALWHAGQRGHVGWFIVMLIVNTAGILEIIYLFGILKLNFSKLFTKHTHSA